MKKLAFYIVDVFAVEKYTGNQLAVFTDGFELSSKEMQRIAQEVNYSETTFLTSPDLKNGGYDVRIFTPKKELPFAGHPTLGTAYIIQKAILQYPVKTVNLNLNVGQIPVTWHNTGGDTELRSIVVDWKAGEAGEAGGEKVSSLNATSYERDEVLWMRQNPPTFHETLTDADLAPVLNLELDEIDSRFPIQEVSTGIPFIIVPLKTHASLKRIKIDKAKFLALVEKTQSKEILVFCPETYAPDNNLSVRVFAEYLGIPEDPATGSANGCLAGYLVKYCYFGEKSVDIRVEQGYEIGRKSLLLLKAGETGGLIEVSVGGKVVMVAKGEFV